MLRILEAIVDKSLYSGRDGLPAGAKVRSGGVEDFSLGHLLRRVLPCKHPLPNHVESGVPALFAQFDGLDTGLKCVVGWRDV